MSDGVKVYLCNSNEEVIDLMARGQGVFGIAVGQVLREVEATLSTITPSSLDEMDDLSARRLAKKAI
jgi:hypothetical protein